jgi:hypothetical protein
MNPRELVDYIRSGPAKVVLDEPLRFRRRTRSNPCDFNEFLQALQSSKTIRTVDCESYQELGISDDEWFPLVMTVGRIKDIQRLEFWCRPGSRDFHPFQAVAQAVNNAQSLCKLVLAQESRYFPGDPLGMIALANALRERTTLQYFTWLECGSRRIEVAQSTAVDPVLWALPGCHHLRAVAIKTDRASADAMNNLLQLQSVRTLYLVLLNMDQWLAMADEIRRGRCNVQSLALEMHLVTISEAMEAVNAVASAIRLDCNLKVLSLQMDNRFSDEAGVVLAEALTINKTLRTIDLSDATANFGAQAYEAFSAMLRVNPNLVLELPPFEADGGDASLVESRKQMIIEQRLNQAGRGKLLLSSQTTREEWVDALYELSSNDANDVDDSPTFQVSCLFSLLRLYPAVCMSSWVPTISIWNKLLLLFCKNCTLSIYLISRGSKEQDCSVIMMLLDYTFRHFQ